MNPGMCKRSAGKTKQDINSAFSFPGQLQSLKHIFNVLLQSENIPEKILGIVSL